MTITKKNGKYYCRFQINGERHHYLCNGAISMKEAKLMEDGFRYKLQQQQNGVIAREDKKIKLNVILDLFENYSKLNKKSYKSDKHMVGIIKDYFKAIIVKDITADKIEDFKSYLINDRELKNSTVNRYMSLLSKAFNIGIANKLIKDNPISFVGKLKEKNYKVRFLTKEEEKRLFTEIEKGYEVIGRDRKKKIIYPYLHLKPLVITALQTGMRRGEIFNLKWSNIDFDYGFIELLETKSGKSRKIPISDTLLNLLRNQEKNGEYVFTNPETMKPYNDIKKSWQTVLDNAHIDNFRFHDLRHTVATRLAENNVDLVVVKEILGHADIQTTMRYAHAVPKRKIEAISVLDLYN